LTGKRHEEGETKEEGARYIFFIAGARSLLPVISPLESRNTSRPSRKKKDRPGYSIPRKRSQKKTLNRENKGELNHDRPYAGGRETCSGAVIILEFSFPRLS
jgi:hypothetical protein